ncbi:MAG: DUF2237 family protein [Glaciecola sp.]|jgi:uncharacterized protein|nr:hypothetical protein OM2255_00162 [alpha proteobacterium HTCC2255] [Rhodobacterales bacterium HTCC2255]
MEQLNVLGESLQLCCTGTGFQRNGFCEVPFGDHGNHSVCAIVTDEFLLMQQRIGNDLITPIPAYQFNGLKAGDRWCLCAIRWHQAHLAGVAPPVVLSATSKDALKVIDLDVLKAFAVDESTL